MATVIDFSASVPSAASIKAAGHDGAVMYISPARESWMGAKPVHRPTIDDFDAHGLQAAFVWQYGAGTATTSDVMRGRAGGIADAKAAQAHLDKIQCSGHPVFFAVDFDISLTQWNNTAVEYFKGAASVLGKQRVGIYGHSRVLHWALEDDVVATVEPGRILGWQTRSWSNGVVATNYAVLYQRVHNVPGPDGIQVDINDVLHPEWGWRALDDYVPAEKESTELMRFDEYLTLRADRWTKGRAGNSIKYVTRHHMGGIGDGAQCIRWWQSRVASAHAAVDQHGKRSQIIAPEDTAWSNAHGTSNLVSYSIEHSNNSGPPGWSISDATLREGAYLAAEVCVKYDLGRPEFGKNIRDHSEFTTTECPYHLRFGHKYHNTWMKYAQDHYDSLTRKDTFLMGLSDAEQRRLLENTDYIRNQLGPWERLGKNEKGEPLTLIDAFAGVNGKINYIFGQLRPWPQLGKNEKGEPLTLVDAFAAQREHLTIIGAIIEKVAGFLGGKSDDSK